MTQKKARKPFGSTEALEMFDLALIEKATQVSLPERSDDALRLTFVSSPTTTLDYRRGLDNWEPSVEVRVNGQPYYSSIIGTECIRAAKAFWNAAIARIEGEKRAAREAREEDRMAGLKHIDKLING